MTKDPVPARSSVAPDHLLPEGSNMTNPTLLHFEAGGPDNYLRDTAVDLAASGYAVVPGRPRTKRPYRRNLVGTTDRERVAAWWSCWPDANHSSTFRPCRSS